MELKDLSMEQAKRPASPGLKWRPRKSGPAVPYWFADTSAINAGYPVKSANLSAYADNPTMLVAQAQRLQSEMAIWMKGARRVGTVFDGTFKSLFDTYEVDPESSYHALKPGTRKAYGVYLKRLRPHIGGVKISATDGRDVKRWFATWRVEQHADADGNITKETDHLPRAHMCLAIIKAAVRFGIICRLAGCVEFQQILAELEFERPRARTWAPTADQIIEARKAAHANGAPGRALLYALQFETRLRQWDLTGQWLPLSDPRFSTIADRGMKWIGPTWADIDDNLILAKIRPTKTEHTTEVEVSFDLSVCPMVMEELAGIPAGERVGALIKDAATGLPYRYLVLNRGWNKDFKDAGLPEGVWNRDVRAGAVTADRKANASKDDVRKLAGHAKETTTEIYDRDSVEAHRRVMAARKAFGQKNAS